MSSDKLLTHVCDSAAAVGCAVLIVWHALHSLHCAEVPLRNCSLTHSLPGGRVSPVKLSSTVATQTSSFSLVYTTHNITKTHDTCSRDRLSFVWPAPALVPLLGGSRSRLTLWLLVQRCGCWPAACFSRDIGLYRLL